MKTRKFVSIFLAFLLIITVFPGAAIADEDIQTQEQEVGMTSPAPSESQIAALESQPAASESQPAASESQPAASESQPAASESQPAASESQPAASESQPTDGAEPVMVDVVFDLGSYGTTTDTGLLSQKIVQGSAATPPAVTANDGYSFTGWDADVSAIAASTTIHAVYQVRVLFDAGVNGVIDTGDTEQWIGIGGNAAAPAVTANEGWTFTGWDSAFEGVTAPLTVTAVYETTADPSLMKSASMTEMALKSRDVHYEENGGTDVHDEYSWGFSDYHINQPNCTRTGYTLDGWYTTSAFSTGSKVTFPYNVTGDVTLYAKWNVNSYTITLNANGGTLSPAVATITKNYDVQIAQSDVPTATWTGHYFGSWIEGSSAVVFPYTVKDNKTWTASWYNKVHFVVANGSAIADVNVNYGNTYTLPVPAARTGYTFSGWYKDLGYTQTAGTSASITSDSTFFACWTVKPHSITLDLNGGTGATLITKNFGEQITEAEAAPTRKGYDFKGWYETENPIFGFSDKVSFPYTVGDYNDTWHAKWEAKDYTITVNAGDNGHLGGIAGGLINLKQKTYSEEYDSDFDLDQALQEGNQHYHFSYWRDDSTGLPVLSNTITVDETNDFTAIFVGNDEDLSAYAMNNGTLGKNINGTYQYGQQVDLNTALPTGTTAGYEFKYWEEKVGSWPNNSWQQTGSVITVGVLNEYRAVFGLKNCTVTFDEQGGSNVPDPTVLYGGQIASEPATSKDHYQFGGWYTDGTYASKVSFPYTVLGSVTLVAKWIPLNYTVTFDEKGGTDVSDVTQAYNSTIDTAPVTSLAGHQFGGWFTDQALTQEAYFPYTITDSVTLYAKWNINSYTVSFNATGGSAVPSVTQAYNTTINTAPATSWYGHKFEGWYTDSTLTTKVVFPYTIQASTTLFAKWSLVHYTISYDATGGSAVPSITQAYNTTIDTAPVTSWYGHEFEGWYTDSTLTTAVVFPYTIQGSTTLVAKWSLVDYTISYDATGGSAVPSVTQAYNTTIDTAPATSWYGHKFEGWYTDSTLATAVAFPYTIQGSTTLVAKWSLVDYTISYDATGGSTVPSVTQAYNTTIDTAPATSWYGHKFEGWYTDSTLTTAVAFPYTIQGSTTLVAKWSLVDYTISYDATGGSTVPSVTQAYNTTIDTAPATSWYGHKFEGWYTDSTLTTAVAFPYTIQASTTLVAKWSLVDYTISYDATGGSAVPSITQAYNTTIDTAPVTSFTGHQFGGWYTDQALTQEAYFPYTITGSATLYAKWNIDSYTISFNTQGGSTVGGVTQAYNTTIDTAPVTSFTGHQFGGWYTDSSLVTAVTFPYTITQSTTLFAKWNINQYTVTFMDYDGTTVLGTATVAFDGTAAAPSDPTRSGFTFTGWDRALTNVRSNLTITATYSAVPPVIVTYSVVFQDYDGTILSTQTVESGKSAVAPAAPARSGYRFVQWDKTFENITGNLVVNPIYVETTTAAAALAAAAPAAPLAPAAAAPAATIPEAAVPAAAPSAEASAAPSAAASKQPTETIAEETAPAAAPETAQTALLNLILAIATAIAALVMVIGYFAGKNKRNIARLLSLLPGIGAIAALLLTEAWVSSYVFADKWTLLMIVIAAAQVLIAFIAVRQKNSNTRYANN